MGPRGGPRRGTPSCAAATEQSAQSDLFSMCVGRIGADAAAAGVHSPRCVLRAREVWCSAATAVLALARRVDERRQAAVFVRASRVRALSTGKHARSAALLGRLQVRAKSSSLALLKQTIHLYGNSSSKDDRRPKSWTSDSQ